MHVLFISMEFPPINSAGIYRQIRFINALSKNGITPLVITFALDENQMKVQSNVDSNLLNLVSPDAKIIRVPLDDISLLTSSTWGRFKYIMNNVSGDNFLTGWEKRIYSAIDELIKKYAPVGVIASCPPFSSAILARQISKKYNLPFILDMRDAWSEWGMAPSATYFHYLRKKKTERSVFSQAHKVIGVTPPLLDKFKNAHPQIATEKFELIYNSPNFPIENNFSVELKRIDEISRVNIGYTGAFYYSEKNSKPKPHQLLQFTANKEDWRYRTPYYFFQTLHHLFLKRPEWKSKIYINYIGKPLVWLEKMAKSFDLENNLIFHGYQTQEVVRKLESKFDILLSTSEKVLDGDHYCLPSKLFTYLLAKKPIFAFVTKGVQKEFISKIGVGVVFDPDQTEQSSLKLEDLLKHGWTGNFHSDYFNEFEEINTSQKFVDLVNGIIK